MKRKLLKLSLGLFVVGILSGCVNQQLAWREITPGQSTAGFALDELGDPEETETRGEYTIYRYKGIQQLLWKDADFEAWPVVEIWAESSSKTAIVTGIYLYDPVYSQCPRVLGQLIYELGQPDTVSWTFDPRWRTLIWESRGIMVGSISSYARGNPGNWQRVDTCDIAYFAPAAFSSFSAETWPCIAKPTNCGFGLDLEMIKKTPSGTIEDPFDWEFMLTSTPLPKYLTPAPTE